MPTRDEKTLETTMENAQFWSDLDRGQDLEERLIQAGLRESPDLADVNTSALFNEAGNSPDVLRIVKSTAADLSQFRETYRTQSSHADTRDTCLAAGGLAMVGACLVVIGTTLFGADDTAGLERQIAYLQNTVKYVAEEQGVSFPQAVPLATRTFQPSRPPRIVIDPPVIIEREVSRHAVPEAIFKNEAVAAQPVTAALEPVVDPQRVEAGSIIKFDQAAGAGQ
ncbi:hypothetical protein ACQU0X_30165 [Pseudovibrio ascidiaceicola]|uniref:hypothetical protein n=1 Tax=Pseudovibrio ascidiaceicola TaxID=285279 RepID=UPI003D364627